MSQSPLSVTKDLDRSYIDSFSVLAQRIRSGNSFSGHERNCAFFNLGNGKYTDLSYALGLDQMDDGRGIAITDFDGDGDPDICMTNRTAPRLRLLRNDLETNNRWIAVRLVGDPEKFCPRDAIGARVELRAGKKSIFRTLYAGDGFLSQSSKWLRFGLGEEGKFESLAVLWPSGQRESFTGLSAGGKFILRQGSGIASAVPGTRNAQSLVTGAPELPELTESGRIRLSQPLKLPSSLEYRDMNGKEVLLESLTSEGPVLVNLWASWCSPCVRELGEFGAASTRFNQAGMKVLALSVDGLNKDDRPDPEFIKSRLSESGFIGESGFASDRLVSVLNGLVLEAIYRHRELPIPTSFLIDKGSWLTVIYKGAVDVNVVLKDRNSIGRGPQVALRQSTPFEGVWVEKEFKKNPLAVASAYRVAGYGDDARDHLTGFLSSHKIVPGSDPGSKRSSQLAEVHFLLGEILTSEKKFNDALTHFKAASHFTPSSQRMRSRMIFSLAESGHLKDAQALALEMTRKVPDDPNLFTLLGDVLVVSEKSSAAADAFTAALEINPKTVPALSGLAWIKATSKEKRLRDGKGAVELAEFLMQSPGADNNPELIKVLAAAHAEAGSYEKSIMAAQRALKIARDHGTAFSVEQIEVLLLAIEEKKPFRN